MAWVGLDVSCGHPHRTGLSSIHKLKEWIGSAKMDSCSTQGHYHSRPTKKRTGGNETAQYWNV